MKPKLAIYWCRRDFRLTDNPALSHAIDFATKNQIPLLPIFILDNSLLELQNKTENDSENNLEKPTFDANLSQKVNINSDETSNENSEKSSNKISKNLEINTNLANNLANSQNVSNQTQSFKSNNSNNQSPELQSKLESKNSPNFQSLDSPNSQLNLTQTSQFHNIGLPRRLFLSRVLANFAIQFLDSQILFEIFLGDFQSVFQVLSQNFELFVFANEDIEPFSRRRDLLVSTIISKKNFHTFADQLTISTDLRTGTGSIYSIFTPFKNAGWESFVNSKVLEKVDLEKKSSVFLNPQSEIYQQIQNLFGQITNQNSQENSSKNLLNQNSPNSKNNPKNSEKSHNLENLKSLKSNKNSQNKTQNKDSESLEKDVSNFTDSGSQIPKTNSKILTKKTNFQDLQTQTYDLISTKWQFVITKHNSKHNSNEIQNTENNKNIGKIDQTDSQNLWQNSTEIGMEKLTQKSQSLKSNKITEKENDSNSQKNFENLELENLETGSENKLKNSLEITANNENFIINLENILQKPNYLEWDFEEELVLSQFEDFLANRIENYKQNRDSLELDTEENGQTSKMSVALKWGIVSSRTLKQKIVDKFGLQITSQSGVVHFLNELIWREFYRYILFHEKVVLDTEFQPRFRPRIDQKKLQNLKEKLSQENVSKVLESEH